MMGERKQQQRESAPGEVESGIFSLTTRAGPPVQRSVIVDRAGAWRPAGRETSPGGTVDEDLLEAVRSVLDLQQPAAIEYALGSGNGSAGTVWFPALITPISETEALLTMLDTTERNAERREVERRADEASRELRVMLGVSANLASQLELTPLLQLIIEQVQEVVDYGRASVYLLDGEVLYLLASRSSRSGITGAPGSYFMAATDLGPLWERVRERRFVLINDFHSDNEVVNHLRRTLGAYFTDATSNVHAQLVVPLAFQDRVIGMLTLTHEEAGFYNEHHAELMMAVGTQAGIAIENARLFQRAQQLAAVEERQRLARELHDSVSQALYGIALGARTARTLLDRDPKDAIEPMEYVLSLAEAGQAEMRALIFELRPESLEREGLVTALQKQIDAVAARYGMEVSASLGEEPPISLPQKEVFYRIGQEALHNVVKHARASKIRLNLATTAEGLRLEIEDDGIGFDSDGSFPGHMGLLSMAERASSVGASFGVVSSPGNGATVSLSMRFAPLT